MLWRRAVQWAFYGGLILLLVLILSGVLGMLLPQGVSSRIAYNSESYLFAIVLAAWVQFGLPRLPMATRSWWSVAHGVLWLLIGVGLLMSGWPSRFVTLNEAALALAVLIPYVSLRRPLGRWVLIAVPLLIGLTVWAVGWAPQSWVIDQAETFGFVILAMMTFDVFDRPLLLPDAQVNRWSRRGWYAFLILEPVIVSGIGTGVRAGGGAGALTLEYLGRIHESFIGVLLVSLVLHLSGASRLGSVHQARHEAMKPAGAR